MSNNVSVTVVSHTRDRKTSNKNRSLDRSEIRREVQRRLKLERDHINRMRQELDDHNAGGDGLDFDWNPL